MARVQPKIVIVTGKGGVGKSLVSASLALASSRAGQRTLLVEFAQESSLRHLLGGAELGFEPRVAHPEWPQLWVSCWRAQDCLRDYVQHILKFKSLTELFFDNAVMKAFIDAAPALSDVALLGKLTSSSRSVGPRMNFDRIIVDGYAAGHILALLRAPQGLARAIQQGPMGEHSRQIDRVLRDPEQIQYAIVSLAEELPVIESLELAEALKADWGASPQVWLNRMVAAGEGLEVVKGQTASENHFLSYLQAVQQRQHLAQQRLAQQGLTVHALPMVFQHQPKDLITELATHLEGF